MWADILHQTDSYIGRVDAALAEAGVAENTIVIFTADNGPEAVPVGNANISPTPPAQGTAGPWRGTLFTSLEGSLRVPFAIRWPGRIPAGGASNEIVHSMDLFPTLAAFAGGSVPDDRAFDGIDQSAFFLGEQETSNRDGLIVYMGDQVFGVKWGDWKVLFKENATIFSPTESFDTPRVYNLLNDPHERDNVLFPPYLGGREGSAAALRACLLVPAVSADPPGHAGPLRAARAVGAALRGRLTALQSCVVRAAGAGKPWPGSLYCRVMTVQAATIVSPVWA